MPAKYIIQLPRVLRHGQTTWTSDPAVRWEEDVNRTPKTAGNRACESPAPLKVQNDILLKMDKQEVTLLILLDLSAAFDTIDHGTMLQILENDFGITDTALCWLSSFLVSRKQRVLVNGRQFRDFAVNTGVPQGSCLGPILFIMYASRLFHVVKSYLPNVHGYADDTQLYLSFQPGLSMSQDNAVQAMEACISDVRSGMINHHLKLNDEKTEFIIIGSRQQLAKVNIDHINVGTSDIRPVGSVRNLGLWFDRSMTMSSHFGKVCSKAFRGLYNIRQIRKFLSEDSTKTLIHAFVTSHLDYCNSLLYGIPKYQLDRLQRVLNAAARLTCYVPRFNHITPTLMELHWLPVKFRIHFKVALLVFKSLHGLAPPYLSELIQVKSEGRYALRSQDKMLLNVPRTTCKTFGDRSFAVSAPKLWNELPLALRHCQSLVAFKNGLKTFLFKLAYGLD